MPNEIQYQAFQEQLGVNQETTEESDLNGWGKIDPANENLWQNHAYNLADDDWG